MRLAIFDVFKTKNYLTGEANRQRAIISILSSNSNPTEKTRTGIAQKMAREQDIAWKNIYSGIFRDFDEVLIPLKIVEEYGRLPLKRGPKALQEKGIPYYHLTKGGILAALSISIKEQQRLLEEFFTLADPSEKIFEETIMNLQKSSPNFTHLIFQKYVKAFCDGKFNDLIPFDLTKLGEIPDELLTIQKENLNMLMTLSKQDIKKIMELLDVITFDNAKH